MVGAMRRIRQFVRGTVSVLTWGGLRGGLSVAMALAAQKSATKFAHHFDLFGRRFLRARARRHNQQSHPQISFAHPRVISLA